MAYFAERTRKHFFRDEQDNRTVVVTGMLPNGEFIAYVDDNDNCDDHRHGIGHSRFAAIADLNEQLEDAQ
jgi:hypothetical protein